MLTRALIEVAISEISAPTTPAIRKWLRANHADLQFKKRDLSRLLHDMKDEGLLTRGSDEVWASAFTADDNDNDNNTNNEFTLVIVDCDNRPDCYENARAHAAKDCHVVGIAGATYNGWKPKPNSKFGRLIQDTQGIKQFTKSMIPFFIAKCVQTCSIPLGTTFVIASGDKTMESIAAIARAQYPEHEFVVVENWEELKIEIE